MTRLTREFFARDTLIVARELLGMRLVRLLDGRRVAGRIVETEAYKGLEDEGCHAHVGLTARNAPMFGPPGHAYVYFTYGVHWMFNIVTETDGVPGAVLIRALEPVEGLDLIAERRAGRPRYQWTSGPAKLAKALDIDKSLNAADLCAESAVLFVEEDEPIPDVFVMRGPRIGLNHVREPWKSIDWRFYVAGNPYVSPGGRPVR